MSADCLHSSCGSEQLNASISFTNSLQQLAVPVWMGTAPGAFSVQLSPLCGPHAMLNLHIFFFSLAE